MMLHRTIFTINRVKVIVREKLEGVGFGGITITSPLRSVLVILRVVTGIRRRG